MARQSDVRSPSTSSPVDIDTPDGSVFGDYTSSETQYEYPWPEKVWQNIEEYKGWLDDERERVESGLKKMLAFQHHRGEKLVS